MRTIVWNEKKQCVEIIDQNALPQDSYLYSVFCEIALIIGGARSWAGYDWNMLDRTLDLIIGFEGHVDDLKAELLKFAHHLAEEDVALNMQLSRHGAELIEDGDHIVHHCNTGALATVDYGTALGVIRMAHEQG